MNGSQGHVERAQTIAQLFWQLAGARGDAVMMRQKELGIWQSYSWNAVRETVSDIAAGLIELGLQPGEVISILSNTRREWLWADLGGLAAGAVVSGVYPTDSASQLEYLCDDSRSVYLFVEDEEQLDKYLTVRERLPGMRRVIVFDMKGLEDFEDPQVMSLDRLCELGRARRQRHPDEVAQRLQSRGREDLAILVYTSGTTGRPKGAMLSNANLLAAIGALDRFLPRLHDAERVSFLPMCHVSERIIGTYYAMLGGARMNFVERPETVFENIQEIQPHLFGGVPRIWEKLYSRVTTAVSEAAPFQQWAYRKAIAWGMAAARHRERGAVDLLERVVVLGRVQGDDRLAERRGVARVERGVPLPVLVAEAHDDHVGTAQEGLRADRVDAGALVVVPELVGLGAEDVDAHVVGGRVVGDRRDELDGQARLPHARGDAVAPVRVDLTGQVNGPGPLLAHARDRIRPLAGARIRHRIAPLQSEAGGALRERADEVRASRVRDPDGLGQPGG